MRRLFVGVILSALATAPALACGPSINGKSAPRIPPLAAVLDAELHNSNLANIDLKPLRALRAKINLLAANNKIERSREIEERAIKILGYSKDWT